MINQHKFRTMLNWYLFHLCLTMTLALSESDPYKGICFFKVKVKANKDT